MTPAPTADVLVNWDHGCPHCGSIRFVCLDTIPEYFVCQDCGKNSSEGVPKSHMLNPRELPHYGYGEFISPLEDMAKRAARVRLDAIERAVTSWAEQLGVSVEQWLKVYGYSVDETWDETGTKLTFVVRPNVDFPGREVVFRKPPASSADR